MSLTLSDWVAVANLLVAVAAIVVAVKALVVAQRTLVEANEDWQQRKWFDLYAKADEVHAMLLRYRNVYPAAHQGQAAASREDWNRIGGLLLETYTMAGVFPQNAAVTALFNATGSYTDPSCAYDDKLFEQLGDAVEALRQKARLKADVL